MRGTRALAMAAVLIAGSALAVQPGEELQDKALEARAREISSGLRCLVCQNQSIDDSDAPLAKDLRLLVRERLQAGDSDQAVRAYLQGRYGDFVLLKPPFTLATLLLWLGPLALLLAGAVMLWRRVAHPAPDQVPAPLTAEEEARLKALSNSER